MTTPKKEYPYHSDPRLVKIKNNLVENFGYARLEARRLAQEIVDNMETYDRIEEIKARTQATMKALYDNHTRAPLRPKTILEQRMEAKRGNV
jgi:hypothetical protein